MFDVVKLIPVATEIKELKKGDLFIAIQAPTTIKLALENSQLLDNTENLWSVLAMNIGKETISSLLEGNKNDE